MYSLEYIFSKFNSDITIFSFYLCQKIYLLNFVIVILKVFSWHFHDIWRSVKYSLHLKLATRLLSICMILWTFDIWYASWVSLLGFSYQFLKNDESSNIILSSQENFSHYQSSNFKNTSSCQNRYTVVQRLKWAKSALDFFLLFSESKISQSGELFTSKVLIMLDKFHSVFQLCVPE